MSLCEKCYSPGACCKRLNLTLSNGTHLTVWDDTDPTAYLHANFDLPFVALSKQSTWTDENGRDYSSWHWSCPRLGADGRCSQYKDRPRLCRDFEPRSDRLCVMYSGESGDPTLGFQYGML